MTTTTTRKRVRGKPADRREQILDEAVRLIGERGYYGFSIREVAHRCQLTDPGLLHYFGSKEKLLIAALEDCDRKGREEVRAMSGLGPVAEQLTLEQLRAVFQTIIRRNSARPELMRFYATLRAEAMSADHPAHAFFKKRHATIVENFARSIADHAALPQSTALLLQSMMRGLEMEWMRAGQAFDLMAEWDRAFDLLIPAAARVS
jgi:AcrR family transcriptional regulator